MKMHISNWAILCDRFDAFANDRHCVPEWTGTGVSARNRAVPGAGVVADLPGGVRVRPTADLAADHLRGLGITELGLVGVLAAGAGRRASAQVTAAVLLWRRYLLPPIPLGAAAFLLWRRSCTPPRPSWSASRLPPARPAAANALSQSPPFPWPSRASGQARPPRTDSRIAARRCLQTHRKQNATQRCFRR